MVVVVGGVRVRVGGVGMSMSGSTAAGQIRSGPAGPREAAPLRAEASGGADGGGRKRDADADKSEQAKSGREEREIANWISEYIQKFTKTMLLPPMR